MAPNLGSIHRSFITISLMDNDNSPLASLGDRVLKLCAQLTMFTGGSTAVLLHQELQLLIFLQMMHHAGAVDDALWTV